MASEHQYTNRLIHESSPYLLQHAHNPVDWYPWGEEALSKAKKEDKLLIISIGYAACHWCHVMEHESFEDSLVADIMNNNFVPIKVDREERPDVDDVYMTACNLVSGRGGWPLNAFALPDGSPIWAGTYFPKDQWINILRQFIQLKKISPDKLKESAEKLVSGIANVDDIVYTAAETEFRKEDINTIAANFLQQIDMDEGGRKGAPKFPMPNNYEFLLKYQVLSGNEKAQDAVDITLEKMAMGGIYDQIGGGFARYSVDGIWKVPHFEKMLYDNGQLVSLYSHAYRQTKKDLFKDVVYETLDFIERELTSPEGGFYSSLDADSEGEEGKFYIWTKAELDLLIQNQEHRKIFCEYYQITDNGNWEEGINILYRKGSEQDLASSYGLTVSELKQVIDKYDKVLFNERAKRIRPGLDDKILSSWNAIMLKGYVDAYQAFREPKYLDIALRNAEFLLENQKKTDNRLNRNYKEGRSSINAFLDDYALLIDAFVTLYQATFDEKWINEANLLCRYAILHFFKESNSMFYYTSDIDPPLVARKSEINDNVIPASNSVMARNLKYLGELLYNKEYLDISKQMMKNLRSTIINVRQPSFYSNWCQLYLDMAFPIYEVAIVGKDYENIRSELSGHYLPNVLLLGGKNEGSLQLLKGKLDKEKTYIYVCQNKTCKFPVTSVEEALVLINQ